MRTVTFYTRENCHLCDDALAAVMRVRSELPFEFVVVDLDREASEDKRSAYDWDIPVIEIDGRKMMKHRVDEARLRRLLGEPSSTSSSG
jgi:glutaredoxin